MNIYQKIADVRVSLQEMNLKKSGNVDFTNSAGKRTQYSYYELADVLPAVNALCAKNGLITKFSIVGSKDNEKAILDVMDGSDRVSFSIPTAESTSLRDPLKDLGAKITYLRRYVLFMAFEVVESDMVEAIKRETTDEVSELDLELINSAKTVDELNKIYLELKDVYKIKLITPIFKEAKTKLTQDKSKA